MEPSLRKSEATFLEERFLELKEFEKLIIKIESKGFHSLSSDELLSLSRLQERTLEDLNFSKTFFGADSRSFILINELLFRCKPFFRRSKRGGAHPFSGIQGFMYELQEILRENRKPILIAGLSFVLPFFLGFFLCTYNELAGEYVITPPLREHLSTLRDNSGWVPDMNLFNAPLVSTIIMSNNIKVAFLAFGLGIFWGLGTLYILFYNGLSLGGVAAATHRAGLDSIFWGFVLPHGVLELTAIFIAGGAGLILGGWAYGGGRTMKGLRKRARSAGYMIICVIPLLILSGFVEAFISPLTIPFVSKVVIALLLLVIVLLVNIMIARRSRRRPLPAR